MEIVKAKSVEEKLHDQENIEPPNDFRDLIINPTLRELHQASMPFLQAIKSEGNFRSVYHYLDANFRLLKEDFMRDLREGLKAYTQMKKLEQNQNNQTIRKEMKEVKQLINFYDSAKIQG